VSSSRAKALGAIAQKWCRSQRDRFCLDNLNALTVKDDYRLPSIIGTLSRIDQKQYISSVDLKIAFWQIELEDRSKEYTAFTVPGRPLN